MKIQFVNPDKWIIVVIGLVQLGIILFGVLAANVLTKGVHTEDLKRYPLLFLFVRNVGLVLAIAPLIWTSITACICGARHMPPSARATALAIGVALCISLAWFMGFCISLPFRCGC